MKQVPSRPEVKTTLSLSWQKKKHERIRYGIQSR
jgi:hypothetical protein